MGGQQGHRQDGGPEVHLHGVVVAGRDVGHRVVVVKQHEQATEVEDKEVQSQQRREHAGQQTWRTTLGEAGHTQVVARESQTGRAVLGDQERDGGEAGVEVNRPRGREVWADVVVEVIEEEESSGDEHEAQQEAQGQADLHRQQRVLRVTPFDGVPFGCACGNGHRRSSITCSAFAVALSGSMSGRARSRSSTVSMSYQVGRTKALRPAALMRARV